MTISGYVVADRNGNPVRGWTGAITVYGDGVDAAAVAAAWNGDGFSAALRPLGVMAVAVSSKPTDCVGGNLPVSPGYPPTQSVGLEET